MASFILYLFLACVVCLMIIGIVLIYKHQFIIRESWVFAIGSNLDLDESARNLLKSVDVAICHSCRISKDKYLSLDTINQADSATKSAAIYDYGSNNILLVLSKKCIIKSNSQHELSLYAQIVGSCWKGSRMYPLDIIVSDGTHLRHVPTLDAAMVKYNNERPNNSFVFETHYIKSETLVAEINEKLDQGQFKLLTTKLPGNEGKVFIRHNNDASVRNLEPISNFNVFQINYYM